MRATLLDWYDTNGRDLPWRHASPDPYHVALSEFMLQQTTVKAVIPYFHRFLLLWPTVDDLAGAERDEILAEWAGLGYYNRAKNLHLMAQAVVARGGFPQTADALQTLPGIGEYTAAAIASIAYDQPILPLDGNIKRVLSRLNRIEQPIDRPSAAMREAQAEWSSALRPSDVPQAFMDFANAICKPRNPACAICPLATHCQALMHNEVDAFPKRSAKKAKKLWQGHIYILETPAGIALVEREANQPLGGMLALPSSAWREEALPEPPIDAPWVNLGEIVHIFTHIRLSATIWYFRSPMRLGDNQFTFNKDPAKTLPSLWRKALELKPFDNE